MKKFNLTRHLPIVCYCGGRAYMETLANTCYIECVACGRVCAGLSKTETVKMWNGAMEKLK